jgi:hypothetical protein
MVEASPSESDNKGGGSTGRGPSRAVAAACQSASTPIVGTGPAVTLEFAGTTSGGTGRTEWSDSRAAQTRGGGRLATVGSVETIASC